MIVLDLDYETMQIKANIRGKDQEFYQDLAKIKNMPGAIYDSQNKSWLLPRNMRTVNRLRNVTKVLFKIDEYTLTGMQSPPIKTAPEVVKDEVSDFNKLIDYYNVNSLKVNLFDFQKLGVITAAYMLEKAGGFLIADMMGLGKTAQALGVANALKTTNKVNKILVSCPKNVKYQWQDEIIFFTDYTCTVIDGYNKEKRLDCFNNDTDFYIINHDQLINDDIEYIKNLKADLIIIDENHYFKSHGAKRSKSLKRLGKQTSYRLGLTGTPMQNHPADIHSIFEFLIPELFGSWNEFKKKYIYYSWHNGYPIEEGYQNLFDLKKKIAPFMIRRLTQDVRNDMPNVYTKTHMFDMTQEQQKIHSMIDEFIEETKEEINALKQAINNAKGKKKKALEKELEDTEGKMMGFMNIQMEVSNSLQLLKLSESNWVRSFVKDIRNFEMSIKLQKLIELTNVILKYDKDFKIVIFSQFARMVKLIKKELRNHKITDEISIVIGQMNEKQRHKQVTKFRENKDCRIIVMSDSGCEGLNLQVASHLINFDMPWNPAKLDQRNGRINRIGSPWKDVFISNFASKNSIDEKIVQAIERKRETFNLIVENTGDQEIALQTFLKEVV